MSKFAERLKRGREAKYESAEQFAHALDLSPHAYRKYERGHSEPNFETLTRICTLLGLTPNDLFPDAVGSRRKNSKAASARSVAA